MKTSVSNNFDNFEYYRKAAKEWKLDYTQIEKGTFQSKRFQYQSDDMIFARSYIKLRHRQTGEPPQGMWTFGIPAVAGVTLEFKGKNVDHRFLLIHPPGAELSCVTISPFEMFILTLRESDLEHLSSTMNMDLVKRCRMNDVLRCNEEQINNLRHLLHSFYTLVTRKTGSLERSRNWIIAKRFLLKGLINTIATAIEPEIQGKTRLRDKAFIKAVECVQSNAKEDLTVKQLTHISGVSMRTLEYAFREKLGLSPKEYIRTYRLNQVNRELVACAKNSKTITQIAFEWGFSHMGQFSKDYKLFFNELPSQTIRKTICSKEE